MTTMTLIVIIGKMYSHTAIMATHVSDNNALTVLTLSAYVKQPGQSTCYKLYTFLCFASFSFKQCSPPAVIMSLDVHSRKHGKEKRTQPREPMFLQLSQKIVF